jgi:O-antigen/teichoic acid export membrane protein
MFFLWAVSHRLIPLIYGPSYTEAIWVQQYLVVTIIIAFWHNLAVFLLLSMGREKLLLGFYLLGLVINLLWCALILPLDPLPGAALAMIITKGVVAVFTVTAAQRRLQFLAVKDLKQVGGALLLAAGIFLASRPLAPWNLTVCFTLLPFFALAACWWRANTRLPSAN